MSADSGVLRWVNHASFVFEYGGVRLICDPWLHGTAFNRGWRLLSPTAFSAAQFAGVSHVWFSHQHPDHFSPRDIRAIAPEARSRITALYQTTLDKKVVRFCKGLNFSDAVELPNLRWTEIAPGLSLMCGKWDDRDSWLAIRTPGRTILNLNDCFIETERQAQTIRRSVGTVDVLLTQFSYANWAGNPEDVEYRRHEAALKFREMRIQAETLQPKIIIPFASFVWFSHEENFYHNADMNRVDRVAQWIESDLGCPAVVMYPGDEWRVGDSLDWRPAAGRYAHDFETMLRAGPADAAPAVPPERITAAAAEYRKRIKARNPALPFIPGLKTRVRVRDLERTYELTFGSLREIPDGAPADICLSSDSLHFALRAPWGANALAVNGRFTVPPGAGRERFFRFFRAGDLNDHGHVFDFKWAANQVVDAVGKRIRPARLEA